MIIFFAAVVAAGWSPAAAGSDSEGETLPTADLEAAFPDWEAWEAEIARLEEAITRFAALSALAIEDPEDLALVLATREEVYQRAAQVEGYVRLRLQLDGGDEEASARQQRLDGIDRRWYGEASAWFSPRLRDLGPDVIREWLTQGAGLESHRRFLDRELRMSSHELDEHDQRLLAVGTAAARQLRRAHNYLSTLEAPEVQVTLLSGDVLDITPAGARTMLWDLEDASDRAIANQAWLQAIGGRAGTVAALLEGIVNYREMAADVKEYDSALAAALSADNIPVDAVTNLVESMMADVQALRAYHRLRKAKLGLESYGTADRFLPLGTVPSDLEFAQARRWIIQSVEPLGAEVRIVVNRAFAEGWIDAVPRPGKRVHGGATYVIGEHPYVLVNWDGTLSALLQMAHEIGHAVHHVFANDAQPYITTPPSSLTAETVAIIFETLLVDSLIQESSTPDWRTGMVDIAIQSMLRSSYRTVLESAFELSLYDDPPVFTAAGLGERYSEMLGAVYGETVALEPWDGFGWLQTPHFFTSPLYMPRYGLASAAALALVGDVKSSDPEMAADSRLRVLALMAAGGSDDPFVLLKNAGADLEEPGTIRSVGTRLQHLVDQLTPAHEEEAADSAAN